MPRKGEQPIPGYRLEGFLGRGGFGEVWRAQAPGGTNVALKFIGLEGKSGLKEFRAIQSVKEIRHANLLPLHAFWMLNEDGDVIDDNSMTSGETVASIQNPKNKPVQLIAAFMLGDQNLEERLRDCQAAGHAGIPTPELISLIGDAARGIDYLNSPRHDLGDGVVAIQHCDIKPQNIMIVGDSAMICDFGLAKALGSNRSMSGVAGSPSYMAPEIINGMPPTETTDQYSLAITYYHLRTGKLPFADQSFPAVLNAHIQGNLDLAIMPEPEQEIIRRAIHLTPAMRYTSCCEMVNQLREAVNCVNDDTEVVARQNNVLTGAAGRDDENSTTVLLDSMQVSELEGEKYPTSDTDTTREIQSKIDSAPDLRRNMRFPGRNRILTYFSHRKWKKAPAIGLSLLVSIAFFVNFYQLIVSMSDIVHSGLHSRHCILLLIAIIGILGDGIGVLAIVDYARGEWFRGTDKLMFFSVAAVASVYAYLTYF